MHLRLAFLLLMGIAVATNAADFRFGTATVDITPDYPVRLNGYAARKTESEGVRMHLFTKALALSDASGKPALLLTIDNVGVPRSFRDQVVQRIFDTHRIPPERIVILSSHTHAAPCLTDSIPNIFVADLPSDQQARIDRYTRETLDAMLRAASDALNAMQPGRIYLARGTVDFAKNRRPQGGPVDHDLPVLALRRVDGSLGALVLNYACHCTTLQGNNNLIHGDWAGVAQREIQDKNPGALAFVAIGCGADANPQPRGELEHVERHGKAMAAEVQRLLATAAPELTEPVQFRLKQFDLPFSPLPSRAEWEKRAASPGIVGYHARKNLARLDRGETLPAALPYLVQTWAFGDQLALVFLPGEVVVDYALAIKRDFDASRLWISSYANWVPCYIPSRRILSEGGYEAEDSLWYYDHPARLSSNTESFILTVVRDQLGHVFK